MFLVYNNIPHRQAASNTVHVVSRPLKTALALMPTLLVSTGFKVLCKNIPLIFGIL